MMSCGKGWGRGTWETWDVGHAGELSHAACSASHAHVVDLVVIVRYPEPKQDLLFPIENVHVRTVVTLP